MKITVRILARMRVSLLCVGALLYSHGAAAMSGNELLQDCRSESGFNSGYCLGIIVGYGYGYNSGRQGGALYQYFGRADWQELEDRAREAEAVRRSAAYYCIPGSVSQGQLRDIVVKFLEGDPAHRHMDAGTLIAVALKQAFPCP